MRTNDTKIEIVKTINKVSTNGKIFGVEFIKKDGSIRRMSCRLGVRKHQVGGKNTTNHIPKYLTVFSQNDDNYRNVNIETITEIKGCGKVFKFEEGI